MEKPELVHSLMEPRALLEALSLSIYWPLSAKRGKGDAQPVLVIPGFMTGDGATYALRRYLNLQGFVALPWEQGRNPGLREDIFLTLCEKLECLHNQFGQRIAIVGWSLGGIYARALAHKHPNLVSQVITLGSPFTVDTRPNVDVGVSDNIKRLYERLNPNLHEDALVNGEPFWQATPPVPTTAIYSRSDGIANWKYCVDEHTGRNNENIAVIGSHMGLTHNPMAFHLLVDRLQQSGKKQFRTYRPKGMMKLLYKAG